MHKKRYASYEMKERMKIFQQELITHCHKHDCYEFEYHWEIWGVMWYPWFLTINGKTIKFTANDISSQDFEHLMSIGYIELIETCDKEVSEDEYDKRRYRVIK